MLHARAEQWTSEQNIGAAVLQMRAQPRTVEQIIDVPVPQNFLECVEVERVQEQTVDPCANWDLGGEVGSVEPLLLKWRGPTSAWGGVVHRTSLSHRSRRIPGGSLA